MREKITKSATLKRLVEALSCAEPLAMQDVLELNNRDITASRKGSVDTDHWAFCIGDHFVPVQIDTMLHSAFKTGCFDVDSIFVPSHCVKRTLSARRSKKIQDIEGILQFPMIQEWCALLDLGFVPLCMASKLGELQRQGACSSPLKLSRLKKCLSLRVSSYSITVASLVARWVVCCTEETTGKMHVSLKGGNSLQLTSCFC